MIMFSFPCLHHAPYRARGDAGRLLFGVHDSRLRT